MCASRSRSSTSASAMMAAASAPTTNATNLAPMDTSGLGNCATYAHAGPYEWLRRSCSRCGSSLNWRSFHCASADLRAACAVP
jgi:hypothetical protein